MSGGGFRAACFSLGSLSYLQRLHYKGQPLLQNVRFISSTSGGSITNLAYSSGVFKGRSFEHCFGFLMTELDGEKLISRALSILKSRKEWKNRPAKSRNLINAFSMAYDELLQQETFSIFSDRQHQPHLEEICVNATEFTNGLPFRFQSQHPGDFPKGRIGNRFIFFAPRGIPMAHKIKLADILASSSCFPSGFEPMIFPNDYTHAALTGDELRKAISFKANTFTIENPESREQPEGAGTLPAKDSAAEAVQQENSYNSIDLLADATFNKALHFGLMDGGVADNQAIDAFRLANDRRRKNGLTEFDLYLACDVTSNFMDGYTLPMEKKKWYNRITVYGIIILWVLCSLVFPALLVFARNGWKGWMYVVSTISVLMAIPLLYLGFTKIKSLFRKKKDNSWSTIFNKYLGVFLGLRISVLKQMISSRIKSVFILANDIYLKQIRRMYYEELFTDDTYKDKMIQNAIYDLSRAIFTGKDMSTDPLHPSKKIIDIAEKARTMGTTLWFDQQHQAGNMKASIVAAGQFTTCYNLLRFLNKKEPGSLSPELLSLQAALQADWERFNTDPMFMMQGRSN